MNTANSQQMRIEAVHSDEDLMTKYARIAVLEERVRWGRERAFLGVISLVFLASATATIYWCSHMSIARMRMPGQGWLGAAATFMGIWVVMMVAMMLPSLVPMLSGYRRSIRAAGETRLEQKSFRRFELPSEKGIAAGKYWSSCGFDRIDAKNVTIVFFRWCIQHKI